LVALKNTVLIVRYGNILPKAVIKFPKHEGVEHLYSLEIAFSIYNIGEKND